MEETRWEQRIHALTHIMVHPTTTPSLHSQLLVSTQIPCYLSWDFPPFLCNKDTAARSGTPFIPLLLQWGISLFFKRVSRFCLPETSWRCKCPFQQPPPLILAAGVEPAPPQWSKEQRREYYRKRLRRKRLVSDVPPLIPFIVPNMLLFLLLLWNPLSLRARQ
ncbi:uncharacterized protein LOC131222836 [Magnolia sinica]|uniref:uncharacterized protein LOC131222836 n=1 Tax=Magnolia sinica TaxID=86752 RepID=UPI002659DBF3|nr:uncharacterized protein LOC131222836 [Magnolia sinica]